MWDPIVFTCMIQVRYKSLLKRLQVVKIGCVLKLNQISRKLLNIKYKKYKKTVFIQAHRLCTCQIGVILYNSYKIGTYGYLYNNLGCNPAGS